MINLYYLVGLPGSGKSTYAKDIAKENGAIHLSSDEIREKYGYDGGDASKHNDVFTEMFNDTLHYLSSGRDVVYDATNVKYKYRISFLNKLRDNGILDDINKKCIVMATPVVECKKNNYKRERIVPEEVIDRMYKSYQPPYYSEGWDSIEYYYNDPKYIGMNGTPLTFCDEAKSFDQKNKHHSLSLGDHCLATGWKFSPFTTLWYAGMIHDCGKPIVAEKINSETHYYSHHNVGSYESMFFDYSEYPSVDPVYVGFLVNHHMDCFFWKDNPQKGKKKFAKRFGYNELDDILMLHGADLDAH